MPCHFVVILISSAHLSVALGVAVLPDNLSMKPTIDVFLLANAQVCETLNVRVVHLIPVSICRPGQLPNSGSGVPKVSDMSIYMYKLQFTMLTSM